jgi:GNAT superfamily N-acetyltransferase
VVDQIINFLLEVEEPRIRVLSPEEAKAAGHDIGEIEEFPIKRLSIPGCHMDFEESGAMIWILGLETEESLRRQGLATQLIKFMGDYARQQGKKIEPGGYTEDGEKYARHVVARHWGESEEDLDAEDFEAEAAQEVKHLDIPTLDDIKAAEPGFFSRKNTKLFGTKKIYQYRNFIVLKNVRKHHGHFGNISYYTSYVIYEFKKTEDYPEGHLYCRGDAKDLQDAKEQIKLKDFRSRLERARDMIAKMGTPAVAESEDDDFADVGDIEHLSAEIPRPMRFRDVPVGAIFSNAYSNRMKKVNEEEVEYENGGRSKLGNPIFMCYPPSWSPATARSYGKKIHTFPRLKENEDEDFDAEMAKEIGTPDPMPNWRDHNVLRETSKFALVTFQNGLTGLICLVPNSYPDRVRVRKPESIRYLMSLSAKEFEDSAVLEFGCGCWSVHDEESEEIERELDGG